MEPTFDKDGYPSEETLNLIKNWLTTTDKSNKELFEFASKAYNIHYGKWQIIENYNELEKLFFNKFTALKITTGGWSGNEAVIDALINNYTWGIFYVASFRGGHYILDYDKISRL